MLLILCIVFALVQANKDDLENDNEELSDEELMKMEDRMKDQKVRCTRRYTPGACVEHVASVWTFDFQILNCTERFGCAASHRTNRFRTYINCMKRCHQLIVLYMQIQTYDGKNDSSLLLRQFEGLQGRREGSDIISSTRTTASDEDTEDYSGDEAINVRVVYGESEETDDYDDILQ